MNPIYQIFFSTYIYLVITAILLGAANVSWLMLCVIEAPLALLIAVHKATNFVEGED